MKDLDAPFHRGTTAFGLVAMVAALGGCALPVLEPGMVVQVADQGVRESVSLPTMAEDEVYSSSTETLAQWLLPMGSEKPIGHRVQRALPPGYATSVMFDGAGQIIAPGVCRRTTWQVNLSPSPTVESPMTPFHRARVPIYSSADDAGSCPRAEGGITAESDVAATRFIQRLNAARLALAERRARLSCDGFSTTCESVWAGLSSQMPDAAFACSERRNCTTFQYGYTIFMDVTGSDRRPDVSLTLGAPPVF